MLIGISGKRQSGKDTIGLILQYFTIPKEERTITIHEWLELGPTVYRSLSKMNNYLPIQRFSEKLKNIASYLLDVPINDFENDEFKKSLLPADWEVYKVEYSDGLCSHIKLFTNYAESYVFFTQCVNMGFLANEPIKHLMNYRDFLIQLGTDGCRENVHPNIWVYSMFSNYSPNLNWIISDLRFINELKFIKQFPSIIIRVDRDNIAKINTITETQLDNSYQEFDYVINNNGTIDDLVDNVKIIIESNPMIKSLFYV